MKTKVEVQIDGKHIPLNEFTQTIIGKVTGGMAESLRGFDPQWKSLTIAVRREE